MKKLWKALVTMMVLIVLSAWLAPMVHGALPMFKFEKVLNRFLMISAVIVCFSFVRIGRLFFVECGLIKHRNRVREWASGFGIALLVLALLLALEISLGALGWKDDLNLTVRFILSIALTGVLVGAFEEFFFRGFAYLKLRNRMPLWPALIVTNLIYSAAHFVKGGRPFIDSTPTWVDSFRVMGASFQNFVNWQANWPGFVGLFLFGMVLSFSFLRTKSLFAAMGLHAGAVFFLKLTSRLCVVDPAASSLIFGGKGFYSGFLGWAFIGLIGVLVYLILSSEKFLHSRRPM